ncbi:MAG: RIP metalloprotease RseP [Deltaproteobacteria bacterium]|nr:RIP metalloprotease RseP [Deltaproteobacteria bacterium]
MILSIILKIIIGLAALSLVVLIHELGHFIAARLCKIEVTAFSLGFGKVLLRKKIGNTEYRLSILPLGGYCKMQGEHALIDALEHKEKKISTEKGDFYYASPLQRIVVAISGPVANFLFAGLVFSLIMFIGYTERTYNNQIVLNSDYTKAQPFSNDPNKLNSGDYITKINGENIENFSQISLEFMASIDEELLLEVQRDGSVLEVEYKPKLDNSGNLEIWPWINPVIESILPNSHAETAGLQAGDVITEMNKREIFNKKDIDQIITEKPQLIEITLQRGNQTVGITIIPDFNDSNFKMGIYFNVDYMENRIQTSNIISAFSQGYGEAIDMLMLTAKGLIMLFEGKLDLQDSIAGPMRLIESVGATAINYSIQLGFGTGLLKFFELIALISIALFFMNLLPIPALDGGQIVLFIFETFKKKPLSPLLIYRYQMIGTIMILVLVFFATTNDILFYAGK